MMALKHPAAIAFLVGGLACASWATDGRTKPLSAARAAADAVLQHAAEHAEQLQQTPQEYAFVTVMLPYGPETVPKGSSSQDARLALETKRFYWQGVRRTLDGEYARRKAALVRKIRGKKRRIEEPLKVSDEALGKERSAVRLVLEDIDFDLAALRAPKAQGEGAKLLERKADLFRTLALLKN